MGLYTRRCVGPCDTVRGNSMFRVIRTGLRAPMCKICEQAERARLRVERAKLRGQLMRTRDSDRLKLMKLEKREEEMKTELTRIAEEKARLAARLERSA